LSQPQKTIVITGGNSGIGFETASVLAGHGWRVVITGRDAGKLQAATAELAKQGGKVEWRIGDYASLDSVRALAAELAHEPRIDVLLNNIGIALTTRQVSRDGNEMMLQVNHLAPFLLTNLLLEKLKQSAPARIVTIASRIHRAARTAGFEDFQFDRSYGVNQAYARTKLYNILMTRELARRLEGTGVTANAIHPGAIQTNIGRDGDFDGFTAAIWPYVTGLLFSPRAAGSRVTVFAATSPELEGVSGRYFDTSLKPIDPSPLAQNEAAARQLWRISRDLVGAG